MHSETVKRTGARWWTAIIAVFFLLMMFTLAGCNGSDDEPTSGLLESSDTYSGSYKINSGPDTGQTGTITVQPTGLSDTDMATITIKDSAGAIIFVSTKGYISPGQNGLVSFGITSAPGASGTPFTVNGGGNSADSLAGPGTFNTGNGDSATFSVAKS